MIPWVVGSNGVKVLVVRVACDEVGGCGVDGGKWVACNDEGRRIWCASCVYVVPIFKLKIRGGEVELVIDFG